MTFGARWRSVPGLAALAAVVLAVGCVRKRVPDPGPPMVILPPAQPGDTAKPPTVAPDLPTNPTPDAPTDGTRDVRVALETAAQAVPIAATGAWRLFDASGGVVARGGANEPWTVQRRGGELRAVSRSGLATAWGDGPLTMRTESAVAFPIIATKRYRGAIRIVAADTALLVINVVDVEAYLRGVVPLEIGLTRGPDEQAAVEAQAIAARSYTWVRMAAVQGNGRSAQYDVGATVNDQVYGGVDAERESTDRAVASTRGQVVKFGGRVVDAPYSSSCGGETAAPEEVWRTGASTYLRRVSDRIPGSGDRYYCDIAPRFSWTKEFSAADLDVAARTYLTTYGEGTAVAPSRVRGVSVESRTPSGRVARLVFLTDRGSVSVRGNDVRYVLRRPGGEILNSTYFTVATEAGPGGGIARVVIRGNGYGHGVGMCQWGAIGRARAGQTARSILAAYYPGTTIGPAS